MQSEQIDQLVTALAIAQGEISPAQKSAENPHFKSKFANLTSVWEACRTQLSNNGIAVIQTIDIQGDTLVLVTTLAHKSGQWIKSKAPIIAGEKKTAQTVGSAITYMRRYSLAAIVGVAPENEDDDGNEASNQHKQVAAAYRAKEPPIPPTLMSADQAADLMVLFSQCSEQHRRSVLENLAKAPYYAKSFCDVPQVMYERLVASANKNIQETVNIKEAS
jgi:hypothetical protein